MSEQITTILKRKLEDSPTYGKSDEKTDVNVLKGELQYFILNFVYHHAEYSGWVIYGGSALRIIHELDRMSVDLDFEIHHEANKDFLNKLKKEMEEHFLNVYDIRSDFLTIKMNNARGLTLKFHVGKLVTGFSSEWVHLTIDLNHFIASKTVIEHRQINHGQLSFVIATYNMSALMASKIAAIFLREQRGIDKNIYDYKGRDIYDLLWYMGKKATPDFDYLNAKLKEKGKEILNIKTLFDKLTVDILNYEKMDDLLEEDLSHLFENPYQFKNWFKNWRDSYLRLLDDYKISNVKTLQNLVIFEDMMKDIFWFKFVYEVEDKKNILVVYVMDEDWIIYSEGNLNIEIDENLMKITEFTSNGISSRSAPRDKLNQYATLFYQKTEKYFKKTNRIMLGDRIITKVIRMTTSNLNQKEQIVLNKSALLSCDLDDLLK